MNSTKASSSNPSKKIKLTIIPPRKLFVNISSDEDVTTTPSPTTTSSSPTPPNPPSKTPSTNQTSSSQENTSSSFQSKLQISPPSSNEPTSPQPLNPLLDNILDVPPRPSNPQPLQSHPSLDITLSLSPITPLDHIHDIPSPPSPTQPQPPITGNPLYYNYHDYHGSTCIVNEIRAKRIAKNANPLTLVAAAQQYPDPYYQAPKSHKPYAPPSKQSSSTRSNASTKYKGKEIAKPITPLSESASEEDSDTEQAQRDKDMQKNLALISKYFKKIYKPTNNNLRTSSNSRSKNVDTSPRYKNDNQTGQFRTQRKVTVAGARETVGSQETKRVKDYTYHKEKMLLCKQAEKGVPLQAEQAEEKVDSNVIRDSPDMCNNDIQTDQNAVECDDERAALANLIPNLTLDTEENKKILKQLKKANASLTQELKDCKSNLEESNTTRDSCLIALQSKQTELETYKTLNDRTVDYDKLERKLNKTLGLLSKIFFDIKEGLKLKAYEISVVKEKHDELVK
ncbi:hypothetical protein Tco_0857515 [Tanacetum coccineum]|uniref:Uncharacterized protein n=1 Tax=Tanacetum coccineum TaxID=301880 RepID=A0ABQ5BAF5_9ASTR